METISKNADPKSDAMFTLKIVEDFCGSWFVSLNGPCMAIIVKIRMCTNLNIGTVQYMYFE